MLMREWHNKREGLVPLFSYHATTADKKNILRIEQIVATRKEKLYESSCKGKGISICIPDGKRTSGSNKSPVSRRKETL